MAGDLSQQWLDVLPPGAVDVWLVCPESIGAEELAILSVEERASHARFVRLVDRQLYLAAHAMLRRVLSRYAPIAPESWQFRILEHGRPEVAQPGCDLRFNLSHTHGLAACIVARTVDVGVDVEQLRANRDWLGVARRFFSPAERADLAALPPEARMRRFYALWSLKEAYIKARGLGLAIPLERFSLRFEPDPHLTCDPSLGDPHAWQVGQTEPTAEHSLAWAVRGAGHLVQVRWFG